MVKGGDMGLLEFFGIKKLIKQGSMLQTAGRIFLLIQHYAN